MLKSNMPSFNDKEGSKLPDELPPVIDAHVHVFPRNIFSAIRKWFDEMHGLSDIRLPRLKYLSFCCHTA